MDALAFSFPEENREREVLERRLREAPEEVRGELKAIQRHPAADGIRTGMEGHMDGIPALLQRLEETVLHFSERLPATYSVFSSDWSEGKRQFPAFCEMMQEIERTERELREKTFAFCAWMSSVSDRTPALLRGEFLCRTVSACAHVLKGDAERALDALLRDEARIRELLLCCAEKKELLERFFRVTLPDFYERAGSLADVEHGGEAFRGAGLSELCGAFCGSVRELRRGVKGADE